MTDRTKSPPSDAEHFHAVRFYNDSESLCRIVADFLLAGLTAQQSAVLIATPQHVALVEARLSAQGLDVSRSKTCGDLVIADAADTLSLFMADTMPEASRFRRAITPLFEAATGAGRLRRVRAYGEMVDLLWKTGWPAAAIQLEAFWNAFANTHAFSLLCGYSLGNAYKNAAVSEICGQHTHVVSADGVMARLS